MLLLEPKVQVEDRARQEHSLVLRTPFLFVSIPHSLTSPLLLTHPNFSLTVSLSLPPCEAVFSISISQCQCESAQQSWKGNLP